MPRNVVFLMGRLGNQLFQYSFAQWLHNRTGLPSRFDLSMVGNEGLAGPRVLQDTIWSSRVRGSTLMPVPGGRLDQVARVMRAVRRPRSIVVDMNAQGDLPVVRDAGSWYLGYWQRAEYAFAVREELRGMFGLANVPTDPVVRVHVRRGDYVALGHTADNSWFGRAVAAALEVRGPVPVEVVSDDPEWCVNTLTMPVPFAVVSGTSALEDFGSLARAEVLVATGSTFSWWAAFLGRPKIVHGPQVLPLSLWSTMDAILVQ